MSEQLTFSFSTALEYLKQGQKLTRTGWNGKGMYLLLVNGKYVTEAINGYHGKPNCYGVDTFPIIDAIYMKTADSKLVAWLASQTDLLADDWQLFGETDE